MTPAAVVPGRSCENCTLCCKVLGIPELAKPRGQECTFCDTGRGCTIYGRRPEVCAEFYCSFLLSPALGEEWKPTTSHMVLGYIADADVIIIYTDPDHPGVWRQEPYLARVKKWARTTDTGYVLIWEGKGALALHGEDEFDLGALRDDQVIVRDDGRGDGIGNKTTVYVVDRDAAARGE